MRYILRFCLQPRFQEEERLDALLRYVKRADIDEVMFFLNCEELFQGHLSIAEYAPWLDTVQNAASKLAGIGCGFSLNPWTTILHLDRGREKPTGWDYQAMVGPDGTACTAVACPADERFTQYLCDLYAHFAALNPSVLWIEDDFRLHNHAPLPWGGCFCPKHMHLFSRALGRDITREEFVRRAFAAGEPNAYRDAWLRVAGDTMTRLSRRLGEAVRAANPRVALGLMSSIPAVHCIEMRDWQAVFQNLSPSVPAHSRPHLPAYGDVSPTQYLYRFAGTTARTVDALPPGTPVYPELENFPHSRFAKSDAMGALQTELSLAVGAAGITLNLFDMMGNGIDEAETFDAYLRARKPYLQAVTALGWGKQSHVGVHALYGAQSSATLHAERSAEHPGALRPQEDVFSGLLSVMGISCQPSAALPAGKDTPVAVCGQYLRNLSCGEIRRLFADHRVLLDGESACILLEMGLGDLICAERARIVPSDSGVNAYEETSDGARYADWAQGRVSCQNYAGDWVDIRYQGDSVALMSQVHDFLGQVSGAGMALVGKRVAVLPYRFPGGVCTSHFTRVRQQMLLRVMESWGVPVVRDSVAVGLYAYGSGFLLANASMDNAQGLSVCWKGKAGRRVFGIIGNGPRQACGAFSAEGVWQLPDTLPHMSTRAFAVEGASE